MSVGSFRFLEDVALADCALEVEGDDVNDLFETAARALAAVMVDPETVPRARTREVRLEASALDLLLYDWLSELIFLKDRDETLFVDARVTVGGDGPFTLAAEARGDVIDRVHMALRADAKAVTFYRFSLERADVGWSARVVIDI